ncbi:MAG TPA: glycosyltransferase [Nevskiaceae bacterium]|nr:glycosyltransferase [Nevskiaceae bacterium]
METLWLWLTIPGAVMWVGLLVAPWLPWLNREHLEPQADDAPDLSAVTVLIPARDEADVIGRTIAGLRTQGEGLRVIVIDDRSQDATAHIAALQGAEVLAGRPKPDGWAGKLWALEQGLQRVATPLVLLLDADIELKPGLLAALLRRKAATGAQFVSLMADLRRTSFWDTLLLPAFVYYFRLLYPFAVSNSGARWVAAAAGGCVLVDRQTLRDAGAFASLRGALIDDCTLARRIKDAGGRTWVGLSRGVVSLRPYGSLVAIYEMVARSAYTQLRYSPLLLAVVTLLFAVAYWLPLAALLAAPAAPQQVAGLALIAMFIGYLPTLQYYRVPWVFALLLPVTGTLYLGMTWGSALRYWRGVGSQWKGRRYAR